MVFCFFISEVGVLDYKVVGIRMFFFFFQAEDGIRDYKVTGVQTCALPISLVDRLYVFPAARERRSGRRTVDQPGIGPTQRVAAAADGEPRRPRPRAHARSKIGRASCRERV